MNIAAVFGKCDWCDVGSGCVKTGVKNIFMVKAIKITSGGHPHFAFGVFIKSHSNYTGGYCLFGYLLKGNLHLRTVHKTGFVNFMPQNRLLIMQTKMTTHTAEFTKN